jgi:hypothetical protein
LGCIGIVELVVPDRVRRIAQGMAVVRLGAGVAMGVVPMTFLRWEPRVAGTSMPLLMRTVGIRDLAVGVGTISALASGSADDLRRWLAAGLVSDALDVAAGVASARSTGIRGVISALVAAPMVAVGLYALSGLREAEGLTSHK